MSEYIHPHFGRREAVSGFTGSAGTAVLGLDVALLWTDGRYFIQAERELSEQWTLMRDGMQDTPSIQEFLTRNVREGSVVGFDPTVHSAMFIEELNKQLSRKRVPLRALAYNIVDELWKLRPPKPCEPLRVHPLRYAGVATRDKLVMVRSKMQELKSTALVLSQLDEVSHDPVTKRRVALHGCVWGVDYVRVQYSRW
jgi:Xaa-Pro aminopeptidase